MDDRPRDDRRQRRGGRDEGTGGPRPAPALHGPDVLESARDPARPGAQPDGVGRIVGDLLVLRASAWAQKRGERRPSA